MSEVEANGLTHPHGVREVDVRVNADPEQVALLRAFAASIAIRMDFDVDAIEDLRMAADEACSLLVRAGAPDTTLHCTFHPQPEEIRVHAQVDSPSDKPPSSDALSWHILTSLTHSATESVTGTGAGHRVAIDLVSRPNGPGGR